MTSSELKYIHLTFQLHKLIAEGEGDSDEADAIRDKMDIPWIENSGKSNEQMSLISAWCYGLTTGKQHDRDYLFRRLTMT